MPNSNARYSALDIARYVVNYYYEQDKRINNLQLNAILYYLQGHSLNFLRYPLFKDDIIKCKFNTIIPAVFEEFKIYGLLDIPKIENYECFVSTKYRPVIRKYYAPHFSSKEKHLILSILQSAPLDYQILNSLLINTVPYQTTEIQKPISLTTMQKYFQQKKGI